MYYVDRLNNGQHPKGRKWLAIGFSFKCVKQPLGSLYYEYYTCEHLRITGQYIVNCKKVSYYCVLWLINLSSNIFTFCVKCFFYAFTSCCCSLLITKFYFFHQYPKYEKEPAYLFIRICKRAESTMLYPTYTCSCAVRYSMHKEDSSTRMTP
jgi:hypothetical protein